MAAHNARAHLQTLFALVILSALAICSPLVSAAKPASARFVLAGPVLAASPTRLTGCRQCQVTVLNESSTRSLNWSASSRGISGVTVRPARGTLQARGRVSVSISVPSTISCPASGTITFTGPANSVAVSWSCLAQPSPTPTPSLTPAPVTPIPTAGFPPSPTPPAGPTQTGSGLTPTATSAPASGGQQSTGTPPGSGGPQGNSVPSILLSVAALLLALLAFALYLIQPPKVSLRKRLLSLVLPASFLRRPDRNQYRR